ncbi:GNAT family N-acetyltransferase [Solirubrobacter soli]|uniref:GNAT family N-acetyltransferase n=1 Tax=Solirubrobacter soli TaxID=363832 RepID=UPI000421C5C0|nr:GNAT family N-acetyltransferase [Solirubrobacter soli]
MWTVRPEPAEAPDVHALIREYFAELTVRYFHRETDDAEIDLTLAEYPANGLGVFLVLRADGVAAGHLGVYPTGELTRFYVSPEYRRGGGGRALLAAAEAWAREERLPRLFLDTRTDLVEARSFYASCGFTELAPPTNTPAKYQDHWFEKRLAP